MSLKIILLKLVAHLPDANELMAHVHPFIRHQTINWHHIYAERHPIFRAAPNILWYWPSPVCTSNAPAYHSAVIKEQWRKNRKATIIIISRIKNTSFSATLWKKIPHKFSLNSQNRSDMAQGTSGHILGIFWVNRIFYLLYISATLWKLMNRFPWNFQDRLDIVQGKLGTFVGGG